MAGNMYRILDKKVEELSRDEQVEGIVWGQRHGYAIATKNWSEDVAGFSSSLVKNAQSLHPDQDRPIVCIEGETSSIFIKTNGNYILTVKRRNLSTS